MEVFHASLQVFLFVVERGTEVSPDLSPEGKVFGKGGILRRQLQADKTSYFGRRWKLDRNRKPRMKVSGCHGN